jgi:hypothetical protein
LFQLWWKLKLTLFNWSRIQLILLAMLSFTCQWQLYLFDSDLILLRWSITSTTLSSRHDSFLVSTLWSTSVTSNDLDFNCSKCKSSWNIKSSVRMLSWWNSGVISVRSGKSQQEILNTGTTHFLLPEFCVEIKLF